MCYGASASSGVPQACEPRDDQYASRRCSLFIEIFAHAFISSERPVYSGFRSGGAGLDPNGDEWVRNIGAKNANRDRLVELQAGEHAPLVIQAALADSPDTLRVLEEFGQSLLQVGHVALLERGRARASLVTAPMGAAAWALKLNALQELVSCPDLETEVKAEVRPVAGAGSARTQDFSWASGATPLLLAVQAAGRGGAASNADETGAQAVDLLLSHGANPEAAAAGETALHLAARYGLPKVVKTLLASGADTLARNLSGDTPHTLAVRTGRTECAELLAKAEKPQETALADELIDEEQAEQAKLNRAREKRREKKSRQREKRADLPAAEQPERELPEKAPAPEKREKSELSGEALQKRVAELRREKTRATQKARHLARRIDEEAAKAEASKAQLLKLQTRSQELRALRSEKKEAVERAEVPNMKL
ncbi:E3 ubiquitin-protein ligase XB3 [Symbiodinium microadriaticum]|uniref:E3 ubiquitin-protein ligase XB3 n=1 Tax=Symbiodinium microadriaticum TaxID=2951 RepID=A0A1Q9EAJ2_SYMMI|nr:E3 ubiquitin-protein ligase XB3 [Symbiodinium microadriaticum]